MIYRLIKKSRNLLLIHVLFDKTQIIWKSDNKNSVFFVLKMSTAFSDAFNLFLVSGATGWSFCSDRKRFTRPDIVHLFGIG